METDQLSTTFAALADPTRRAILARLATGEATVNELAEPFQITVQAVSKHVKVLEKAGLISKGRDAQYRPCRLEAMPLDSAISWMERHRQVWNDRLDLLEQHLRKIQSQHPKNRKPEEQTSE
jgi:DNA-binding transcriptional ArsR family regulator